MDVVRLDFYKNGLRVKLDAESSFKDVRYELIRKLEPMKKFLGNTTAAVKIEGRILNDEEEKALYQIISNHTDFNIAGIFYDDEETLKVFDKIIKLAPSKPVTDYVEITKVQEESSMPSISDIQEVEDNKKSVFSRASENIKRSDKVASDNLVIYGNVEKGETVVSEKSIFVLGSLLGEAYAGIKTKNSLGDKNAVIFALEMDAEQIGIADFSDKPKSIVSFGLGNKNKYNPTICYVKDGKIKTSAYTKDISDLIN